MQPNRLPGLLVVLMLWLVGLIWLIGRPGIFSGFSRGFWNGFFQWLFMGSHRPPGSRTPLGSCLLMVAFIMLSLLLIGIIGSLGR